MEAFEVLIQVFGFMQAEKFNPHPAHILEKQSKTLSDVSFLSFRYYCLYLVKFC